MTDPAPASCSATGSPAPPVAARLGGVPGRCGPDRVPATAAWARDDLAGAGTDPLGRLVCRSQPGLRGTARAVRRDLRDGPVDGCLPGPATGRGERIRDQRAGAREPLSDRRHEAVRPGP